jgi:hypothetical protein
MKVKRMVQGWSQRRRRRKKINVVVVIISPKFHLDPKLILIQNTITMRQGLLHFIWSKTRSLIQNDYYQTNQVLIPNSDDETIPAEWREVADQKPLTHLNLTTHLVNKFYDQSSGSPQLRNIHHKCRG